MTLMHSTTVISDASGMSIETQEVYPVSVFFDNAAYVVDLDRKHLHRELADLSVLDALNKGRRCSAVKANSPVKLTRLINQAARTWASEENLETGRRGGVSKALMAQFCQSQGIDPIDELLELPASNSDPRISVVNGGHRIGILFDNEVLAMDLPLETLESELGSMSLLDLIIRGRRVRRAPHTDTSSLNQQLHQRVRRWYEKRGVEVNSRGPLSQQMLAEYYEHEGVTALDRLVCEVAREVDREAA